MIDLSTMCPQIILASSSKSRIEYLESQKIDFKVRPHRIDERIIKKKKISHRKIVQDLAEAKARSVIEKENEIIRGLEDKQPRIGNCECCDD